MSTSTENTRPAERATAPSPIKPDALDKARGPNTLRLAVGIVVIGVAVFFGLRYLADNLASEDTDDAFIDGHIVSIAAKISGEVIATHITENQEVKTGDLLAEIDPKPFDVRVSQRRAALSSAEASAKAFEGGFELMRARVKTSEATHKQTEDAARASKSAYEIAEANWNRAMSMWTNGDHRVISQQDYDTFHATMNTAKANWESDIDKAASDASRVNEAQAELDTALMLYKEATAKVTQAQADLEAAELEDSYTKLVAPTEGRVTRKMVEKGAYVQPGQNLLAIVRPEIWVTANFKETQTAKIRPGQKVTIAVDGLKEHVLHGHVDSLQSGSGARFSMLPPENAVGNYVKVVQRVPVKIVFDDSVQAVQGLGPGMSVTPSIHVAERMTSDFVIGIIAVVVAILAGAIIWVLMQRKANRLT
jgi:membrane fusion protein (multidrug efflux system)